jgi:hypothetical protein
LSHHARRGTKQEFLAVTRALRDIQHTSSSDPSLMLVLVFTNSGDDAQRLT